MTANEYQKLTNNTDSRDYSECDARLTTKDQSKFVHYVLGLGTESGELQDILKRHIAYGKVIDSVHVKEEIGDLLWYIARLCSLFDTTIEKVMEMNIKKLKARYGEKFTEEKALNRNLEFEFSTLNSNEVITKE